MSSIVEVYQTLVLQMTWILILTYLTDAPTHPQLVEWSQQDQELHPKGQRPTALWRPIRSCH
jgi:hypothetical protein